MFKKDTYFKMFPSTLMLKNLKFLGNLLTAQAKRQKETF